MEPDPYSRRRRSAKRRSASASRRVTPKQRQGKRGGRATRSSRSAVRGRSLSSAKQGAERQLQRLRQASIVAVAFTGLLLLLVPEAAPAQEVDSSTLVIDTLGVDSVSAGLLSADTSEQHATLRPDSLAREAGAEAAGAVQRLFKGFAQALPKLLVALLILVGTGLLARLVRPIVLKVTKRFDRGEAYTALVGIALWLLAFGLAVSVLAGDLRALVGSLGLIGLALSWSLQTPIESFTGWLLNAFQGYFRVGDRIAVGEVHGDVFRIDFLTTTVWEIGGPQSVSGIQAEQPTGRMITFPNSEVLAGTIVNYTRDFPFVWDELGVSVATESDLAYASSVVEQVARETVGEAMQGPARQYTEVLKSTPLDEHIVDVPEVYVVLTDWGANLVVRYLVPVRGKRGAKSKLAQALVAELNRQEHTKRILPVYPREQIQLVGPNGDPQPWPVVNAEE